MKPVKDKSIYEKRVVAATVIVYAVIVVVMIFIWLVTGAVYPPWFNWPIIILGALMCAMLSNLRSALFKKPDKEAGK